MRIKIELPSKDETKRYCDGLRDMMVEFCEKPILDADTNGEATITARAIISAKVFATFANSILGIAEHRGASKDLVDAAMQHAQEVVNELEAEAKMMAGATANA